MARIRQIKPEFFLDEDLAYYCCRDARLLYEGLWILADREGRLEDRPARIKAQIFPYDEDITTTDIVKFIDQLESGCFVLRYQIDNQKLLLIRTFTKHQHIHPDEKKSLLPAPLIEFTKKPGNLNTSPEIMPSSTSTSTSTYGIRHTASGDIASQYKPVAKRRRQTQKTGCPDSYEPSDKMVEWAIGLSAKLSLNEETDKFLDYHRSKGNSFADWDAAWRTWIRNAVKFSNNGNNGHNSPASMREQAAKNVFRELMEEQNAGLRKA